GEEGEGTVGKHDQGLVEHTTAACIDRCESRGQKCVGIGQDAPVSHAGIDGVELLWMRLLLGKRCGQESVLLKTETAECAPPRGGPKPTRSLLSGPVEEAAGGRMADSGLRHDLFQHRTSPPSR